jgi:hypothetical protein
MKRLPTAVLDKGKLKQSLIINYSGSFITGLTAQAVTFPAPPVSVTDLNTFRNTFQQDLANALKGSTADTQTKNNSYKALVQALKADVTYVNQVIQTTYEADTNVNYATLKSLILSTGLKTNKNVGRPNPLGNSRVATTISAVAKNLGKTGTNVNGVLKVRVTAAKKYGTSAIKSYWLQYRTPASGSGETAVPAGPWIDYISTSSRIQKTGVNSGQYDYMVAPVIGVFQGKDQLNWSPIQQVIVT